MRLTSHSIAAVLVIVTLSSTAPVNGQANGRPPAASKNSAPPFSVVEASIADMRTALEQKRVTSRELVRQYLTRMAMYEDRINAIIAVNPNALAEADARDTERAQGKVMGPLHGIPIALKDNINTSDMPTTGGALAFADLI